MSKDQIKINMDKVVAAAAEQSGVPEVEFYLEIARKCYLKFQDEGITSSRIGFIFASSRYLELTGLEATLDNTSKLAERFEAEKLGAENNE